MPIRKKDRNFQNIVRELQIKSVPIEFVEHLTLVTEDGDRVNFNGDMLNQVDAGNDLVPALVRLVEEQEDMGNIVDVEIVIDYKKLEKEVNNKTKRLLEKTNNDNGETCKL